MRVTVCELPNEPGPFAAAWGQLAAHVQAEGSDLVLLPEMPFSPWLAASQTPNPAAWAAAVAAHDRWLGRLDDLGAAWVLGSRPVVRDGARLNMAFRWQRGGAVETLHPKHNLPDEPEYWEASWYDAGPADETLVACGDWQAGFTICTEMWFMNFARAYGQAGAHLLLTPRATPLYSRAKWLVGGQAAAVIAGAYHLSSNRSGADLHDPSIQFGGAGWIIDPDGVILAQTTGDRPFVTVDINIETASTAKQHYPRYVAD